MITKKDCRPCSWCCYFAAVKEIGKNKNEWCKHLIHGEGCSIYDERPVECSTFECIWLQDKYLEEEFRPDQCGVMFEIPHDTKIIAGLVDPDRPYAWMTKRIGQLINKFIEADYRVMIRRRSNGSSDI